MTAVLLAITRVDVANYLNTLLILYLILIFVRILLTWLPRVPYNRVLDVFLTFVTEVVDPYLNLFRRFLPLVKLGPAAIDISPIVATLVLLVVGRLVIGLIAGG
jgi:YggT family protein